MDWNQVDCFQFFKMSSDINLLIWRLSSSVPLMHWEDYGWRILIGESQQVFMWSQRDLQQYMDFIQKQYSSCFRQSSVFPLVSTSSRVCPRSSNSLNVPPLSSERWAPSWPRARCVFVSAALETPSSLIRDTGSLPDAGQRSLWFPGLYGKPAGRSAVPRLLFLLPFSHEITSSVVAGLLVTREPPSRRENMLWCLIWVTTSTFSVFPPLQ